MMKQKRMVCMMDSNTGVNFDMANRVSTCLVFELAQNGRLFFCLLFQLANIRHGFISQDLLHQRAGCEDFSVP